MQKILIAALAILLFSVMFFQCSKFSIDGKWQAALIIDHQTDTLDLDLSKVELLISEFEYTFNSTLNHSESGTIEHTGKHLILYPSSGQAPYKLAIVHFDDQSLILDMKTDEFPRRIHFKSKK